MIRVDTYVEYSKMESALNSQDNVILSSSNSAPIQLPAPVHGWFISVKKPDLLFNIDGLLPPTNQQNPVSRDHNSIIYSFRAEIKYNFPIYYRNKGIIGAKKRQVQKGIRDFVQSLGEGMEFSESDDELLLKDQNITLLYGVGPRHHYFTINSKEKRLERRTFNKELKKFLRFFEAGLNMPYKVLGIGVPDTTIYLDLPNRGNTQIISGFLQLPGITPQQEEANNGLIAEIPEVGFEDIGGYAKVKEEMQTIVYCIRHPEILEQEGITLPRGVILYGPPGTGKSTMLKAVAHESGVPYIDVDASTIFSKWLGETEQRIKRIFDLADHEAREKGACIIGFDELDALTHDRSSPHRVVDVSNLILKMMDGTIPLNPNVILFGTTNAYDRIDPAFLRLGRFDRQIMMDLPDVDALTEIWKIHLRGKNIDQSIDYKQLAERSYKEEFSGADVFGTVKKAVLDRINLLRKGEVRKLEPMTNEYLLSTIDVISEERKERKKLSTEDTDLYV